MRAVVRRSYGPPRTATVEEVDDPSPGPGEIVVRTAAATVGAADAAARSGTPRFSRLYFGLRRPRHPILGSEFAGRVVAVGPEATAFRVDDEVVGITGPRFGAHAELVRVGQDDAVVRRPAGLGAVAAVALADTTAVAFLRDEARLRAGQRILILGATGAVGGLATQLAVHLGAAVTAVCRTDGVALATRLGAERVIDYTREDAMRDTARYDVVFDAAGRSSFARCRRILVRGGIYLSTGPSLPLLLRWPWFGSRRARVAFTGLRPAGDKRRDLEEVMGLAASGALIPVIDGVYGLDRIADAYARVDTGHKKGAVVLTMEEPA